jgi:ribosome-associated protein
MSFIWVIFHSSNYYLMRPEELKSRGFEREFVFSAVRSAGPGGQNVNKVNSKVELRFSVAMSCLLSDDEKLKIQRELANRINTQGELVLSAQAERSQLSNKQLVVTKFFDLLALALTEPVYRKASKPTFASKIERLKEKRILAVRKQNRRRITGDD